MKEKIYRGLNEIPHFSEGYITIGNFDGLHLGHQEIINKLISDSKGKNTIAITFEKATSQILHPESFRGYIFPQDFKNKALSKMGIKYIVLLNFNEIASLSSQDFLNFIKSRIKSIHLYVGNDFKFGKNNHGNIYTLMKEEKKGNFSVTVLNKRCYKGIPISSSIIRQEISRGDLKMANTMLGRPYFITSEKIKGNGIGSKIGFPTINLKLNEQVIPESGVYFSLFYFKKRFFPSMTYIGKRPTLNGNTIHNETNILEFDGDFKTFRNGEKYTVLFLSKTRDEKKLNNLEELQKIIYNDRKKVLELYTRYRKSMDEGSLRTALFDD